MKWKLEKEIVVGGLTALGFSGNSKYLLVVGHSGRGLFGVSSGLSIARDYTVQGPWYIGTESEGIGPCSEES